MAHATYGMLKTLFTYLLTITTVSSKLALGQNQDGGCHVFGRDHFHMRGAMQ